MTKIFFTYDKKRFYPLEDIDLILNKVGRYGLEDDVVLDTIRNKRPMFLVESEKYKINTSMDEENIYYDVEYNERDLKSFDYMKEFKIFVVALYMKRWSLSKHEECTYLYDNIRKMKILKHHGRYSIFSKLYEFFQYERGTCREENETALDYLKRIEEETGVVFDYN